MKCYAITFKSTRECRFNTLYSEGIFESKGDAAHRIMQLADDICKQKNMSICDYSTDDYVDIVVRYKACDYCSMYDPEQPCIGECSAEGYQFGLAEYELHKKVNMKWLTRFRSYLTKFLI